MEELEKLIAQVRILSETVTLQTQRQEQLFKMQEEGQTLLQGTIAELKQATDNLAVTDEALKRSLDESDQALDDLAQISAALLQLQKSQQENAA